MLNVKRTSKYSVSYSKHPQKHPNLTNINTGMTFYNNNDPLGEVKNFILSKKINVPHISVFLGMGLFYNIITYNALYNNKDFVYIVVERDPELFHMVLEYIDIKKIIRDSRVHILVGMEHNDLYPAFHKIMFTGGNKFYSKAINYIEEAAAFMNQKEYYMGVVKTFNDATKEVVLFFGNDPLDSLIGIDHTFVNIKEIIENPGIMDLKDKFKGRPGIVVATGPSLSKNVHLLEKIKDKAVICSVDASLRVLKNYGLKPHMVSSLERVEATSRLFEGLTEEEFKDVFLAACPVVYPTTYKNFKGERIVVYRNFATFEWLDIEKGTLDIGPSSANMSFKVLEYMGCDPIILIGQDLAFGENEQTHATGSTYGEKEAQYLRHGNILFVEGNYVPQIKTTTVWNTFRKYYVNDVNHFKGTVINATEGGAKIHGTVIMPFAEAIEKYVADKEPLQIPEFIRSVLHVPTEEEKQAEYDKTLRKVQESIKYCEDVLQKIYNGYVACNEYHEQVIVPYQNTGYYNQEVGLKLLKQNEELMAVFTEKPFFHILMHYVQSYYIKAVIDVQEIRAGHEKIEVKNNKVTTILRDLFAVMVELIKKMLGLMYILRNVLKQSTEMEKTQ
jgi:hypothetical protein